jgi:hypothetical protein
MHVVSRATAVGDGGGGVGASALDQDSPMATTSRASRSSRGVVIVRTLRNKLANDGISIATKPASKYSNLPI